MATPGSLIGCCAPSPQHWIVLTSASWCEPGFGPHAPTKGWRRCSNRSIKTPAIRFLRQRTELPKTQGRTFSLSIKAASSTGPFTSDTSWTEWGRLDSQQVGEEVLEDQKKNKKKRRTIAGVDQTVLLEPHLLADPDSRFAEYSGGIQIHYKIARPAPPGDIASREISLANVEGEKLEETSLAKVEGEDLKEISLAKLEGEKLKEISLWKVEGEKLKIPAILLHGFGASLFTWQRVMSRLAEILGAPVLAFDRPAFGLTSRSFPTSSNSSATTKGAAVPNPYTVDYSAAATVAFVNFLQSDKAILIGHSAGSLVAVEAYFQFPEKIAAIVLVAPALMASLPTWKNADSKKSTSKEAVGEERKMNFVSAVRVAILRSWVKFMSLLKVVQKFVLSVIGKLLQFLFRSPPAIWLVQRIMDKGGPFAVRNAFFDVLKADKYVLDGYTRPLRSRHWERALLEYCLAFMDRSEVGGAVERKLQNITCPVLIVTGDTDRFVPDWNSEKLAKVFPCGKFKRIRNCGHLPQEETPDEFLEILKDWFVQAVETKQLVIKPATVY